MNRARCVEWHEAEALQAVVAWKYHKPQGSQMMNRLPRPARTDPAELAQNAQEGQPSIDPEHALTT